MINNRFTLEYKNTIPSEYGEILFKGISDYALEKKRLSPMQPFGIFIKNEHQTLLGGISAVTFYGALHIDSLWIDQAIRYQGWGTQLMKEAEKIGKERKAFFSTVNTMDWEGLPFYQRLGYSIEFIREGYDLDSKMYMLRKNL